MTSFVVDEGQYTEAEVFAYLAVNSYDSIERNILKDYAGKPFPLGMTYYAARAAFIRYSRQALAMDPYPADRLDAALKVGKVLIAPTSVTYGDGEASVVEPISRGYMLPKDKAAEAIKAHVADAFAYTFTPNTTIGQSGTIVSNFEKVAPTTLLPKVSATVVSPGDWKASQAVDNARTSFKTFVSKPNEFFRGSRLMCDAIKTAAVSVNKDLEDKMTRDAVSPVKVAGATVLKNGKETIVLPRSFIPKFCKNEDTDVAWLLCARARQFRGEDGRWISPLSVGYYSLSMTRSTYRVYYETADVLHVLRKFRRTSLVVEMNAGLSYHVCTSIAANGYPVYIESNNVPTDLVREKGIVKAGVYHVRPKNKMIGDRSLLVTKITTTKRAITSRNDVRYEEDYSVEDWMRKRELTELGYIVMAYMFIAPQILAASPYEWSVHAHAGHVLSLHLPADDGDAMSARLCSDEGMREKTIERFTNANIAKTWFPYSRAPFYLVDSGRYGFVNLGLHQGLCLNTSVQSKTNNQLYLGEIDLGLNLVPVDDDTVVASLMRDFEMRSVPVEPPKPIPVDTGGAGLPEQRRSPVVSPASDKREEKLTPDVQSVVVVEPEIDIDLSAMV